MIELYMIGSFGRISRNVRERKTKHIAGRRISQNDYNPQNVDGLLKKVLGCRFCKLLEHSNDAEIAGKIGIMRRIRMLIFTQLVNSALIFYHGRRCH